MKKFISALSSVVIAATAMGSSMVITTDAAVNGKVDETIVAIRSDGKSEITAKAGGKVPVSVYIPQSSGFYSLQLKFAIGKDGNYDETIGQGYVIDRKGNKIENHKDSFGNYGIKMVPKGDEIGGTPSDFVYPNCLESGRLEGNGKGDSLYAGDVVYTAISMVNPESWSVLYQADKEIKAGQLVDSFGAWEAAGGVPEGKFDYTTYTPVTTWTKDESWAYKYEFLRFDLELPSDLADGTYEFSVYEKEFVNTHPTSLFSDDNVEFPDDKKGKVTSNFNSPDGKQPFSVEKLTIHVGDAPATTTTPAATTEAPVVTTEAPAPATTTLAATTEAPVVTTPAVAATTEPIATMTAPAENAIIYNLIPNGKEYISAQEKGYVNNICSAKPGEKMTVDWTIKNDQGTAGLQMNFDFTQVKLIDAEKGNAYRVSPTYSDHTTGKGLKEGQVIYTWAQSNELTAQDDRVIYSFNIQVPETPGKYTVGTREGSADDINKVVPKNQDAPHAFVFYGLDINVEGETTETTVPAETTTAMIDVTTAAAETTVAATTAAETTVASTTVAETTTAPVATTTVAATTVAETTVAETTPAPATTTVAATTTVVTTPEVLLTTGAQPAETTAPAVTTNPSATTEAPKTGKIIYNLVPGGKEYTPAAEGDRTNNVYVGKAGEFLRINWTVKNDMGTAGIQMNFDFSEVTYTGGTRGEAYRVAPTFSDNKNTQGLKEGEIVYTWAQSTELKAADDSIIYTFFINVPNADGKYTIGLSKDQNDVNKVVPRHQDNPYEFEFHGLEIVVGDVPTETTTVPAETTAPAETTVPGATTTTAPVTTEGNVTTDPQDANTLYGDVNCDGQVRIGDVVLLNRYLAKNATVTEQGLRNANCEKDDKIDSKDAVKIKKFLALLIKQDELGKKSS